MGSKERIFKKHVRCSKKKITDELETYFPDLFDNVENKEIHGELKKRAKMVLLDIIKGTNSEKEINEIDDYLFGLAKPKEYSGKKGAEVEYVKKYEEMSLVLTKYSQKDAKKMNVLEYYQAYIALKKENKANQRANRKRVKK